MREAEATLDAIRSGQVDALVVSGPEGEQTLTLEGATHPYFVLLNAMSDGAVLLEPDGAVLFGNRSFGRIAGVPVETLRGSRFQRLLVREDLASFEEFLHQGSAQSVAREFRLLTTSAQPTPVSIALSALPLGTYSAVTGSNAQSGHPVLMAIITDLTDKQAAYAIRAALLERLISAEDDERRRIARELHDETGQSLTALLVGLRAIEDMSVRAEVRRIVVQLRKVAAQTVDDVGRLARGLHPAVLDDQGLGPAATRYVRDYVQAFGTAVEFVSEDLDSPRLPPLMAATLYRILQEALTNVARHAHANHVTVRLARDESALELRVRDDGIGFESRTPDEWRGLGLRGMRERVTLLGGTIDIESSPGQGTMVHARIPTGAKPGRQNAAAPDAPNDRRPQ